MSLNDTDSRIEKLLIAQEKSRTKRDYIMIFLITLGTISAVTSLVILFLAVYNPDKQLTVTFSNLPWNNKQQIDGVTQ